MKSQSCARAMECCSWERKETAQGWRLGRGNVPIQKGEIGGLGTSLVFCLISSKDLPMRASLPLANFAFARRCCGV